jgi:2-hydroxychromene-2-carboxylate isomerase
VETGCSSRSRLEFWFDFGSTYSYLSAMRIQELASEAGVEVVWLPFLLGPIFAKSGWQTSPFNIFPVKGRYMWRDVERLAALYGLPLCRPASFPQFALTATRVATAAAGESWLPAFCQAVFTREFGKGGEITSDTAVAELLLAVESSPEQWLEVARTDEAKNALRQRVSAAEQRGIFGAPSFVTADGELFWGNDRLEQSISHARSAPPVEKREGGCTRV